MAKRPNQQVSDPDSAEATALDITAESFGSDFTNLINGQEEQEDDDDQQPTGRKPVQFDDEGQDDGPKVTEGNQGRREDGHDDDERRDTLRDLTQDRVSHTDQRRPLPRQAEVRADKQGNLRDPDGNIIAPKGPAARFYMQAHKARTELEDVREQARVQTEDVQGRLDQAITIGQELITENEGYKSRFAQIEQLGISPEEHLEVLQMAAEYKRSPLSMIRKLLTRAAASGTNITELGLTGNSDPAALLAMVREEITKGTKPLRDDADNRRQEREQLDRVNAAKTKTAEEVNRFFTRNRTAQQFMPVFENVFRNPANSGMTLDHIWTTIQLNLARRGFASPEDFIRAKVRNQDNGRRENRPIPRGRGRVNPGVDEGPNDDMAPITASYDDIAKGVLKDYNFGRTDT